MFTLHPSIYLRNYHKFFRATRNTGFGTLFTQKKIILNKPVAWFKPLHDKQSHERMDGLI